MTGIDLKLFRKWILREIGKKCPDYSYDCIVCRTWRLFEELEAYDGFMTVLDKYDIDPMVRPHKMSGD
jgi:hypothetical protein